MSFPFSHANGNICCSTREACCDNCKTKLAAEARAAGTRPNAIQRMQDAAHQTHKDSIHLGADCDDAGKLSANASFKERYAAERTREFAELRAASRVIRAHNDANPPTMRALEEPDEIPNGYARALEERQPTQHDITPDWWPRYDPYGTPPNGYMLAIALRQLQDGAAPAHLAAASRPENLYYDENGVPDGYAAGIAKMRSANR